MGICDGRIVVITGAGPWHRPRARHRVRPAGREIVVNNLGAEIGGRSGARPVRRVKWC